MDLTHMDLKISWYVQSGIVVQFVILKKYIFLGALEQEQEVTYYI